MKRTLSLILMLVLLVCSSAWSADVKVSALPATTTLTDDDLFMTSTYLTGVYTSKKITVTSLKTVFQPYDATLLALAAQTETEGSIQYYTAAATPAVLAKGTAYQLLNMNSGATAPAWTSTLGATGTRLTKIWATDLEITNAPTINGAALTTILQPLDGELTALAGLTSAANAIPYFTGSGTASVISSSADMISLLGSSDYATALTNLGGQASDSALTSLSSKVFAKTALTGAGGLDTVLYDDIADGDIGMVGTVAGVIYWYVFEASSATAESSPSVIAPDDVGVNNGRWLLKLYCDGSYCSTVQGASGASSKWLEGSANGTDYMQLKADDDVGTNRKIVLSSSVASSEDLSIQLGANDNTVTIGSSTGVTSIGFGAIGLATTGTISGGTLTPVIDDPDNFAAKFTGANLYGGTFIANAAGTAALPAAAVGMNFTIVLEGANAVILDPDGTGTADTIVMNGLEAAADENITSSTSGAMCVFQYRAANSWMATCNGFSEATPP